MFEALAGPPNHSKLNSAFKPNPDRRNDL